MLTLSTPHIQFYNSTKYNLEKKKKIKQESYFMSPPFWLSIFFFNIGIKTFLLHSFSI